jgi:tRNA(fMet)-specific endonuclease VapC
MEAILLDTDVFSFFLRRGDTRRDPYRPYVMGRTIALSFISVGELYVWPTRRNWGAARVAALEEALAAAMIIPYDLNLCRECGRVKASLPKGRVVGPNDLWIAVCAIRHSVPLLTHNRRHFEGISQLRLLSDAVN